MNALSVIIPSRTESNLRTCVSAIRAAGETCRIIVVDDLHDSVAYCEGGSVIKSLCDMMNLDWWIGMKPFIFARNVNIGIRAAGTDDVVLCNDDALLESPRGFTRMQEACPEEYGAISATSDVVGNPAQHRRPGDALRICGDTPGNSFPAVAFVCVFIPRCIIDQIGLLDERFGGITGEGKRIYGSDDIDYCRRLHARGFKIGIADFCYVNHSRLTSTFRSAPHDVQAARDLYLKKWGSM
jgi:hypothetical protein